MVLGLLLPALLSSAAAPPPRLASDTVWSGVVEIAADVVVGAGCTLVVLPGTQVRFARAAGTAEGPRLTVAGTLVAQGRPGEPILFTSAAEAPEPGDWGGIVFEKARERVSRLRHCRVEYAHVAVQGRISALVAEESSFRRNRVGVRALQGLEGGLFDCDVSENGLGIHFDKSSGVLVENCRIERNLRTGILCAGGSSPQLTNCRIADNGRDGVACVLGASPRIEGNLITGHERGVFTEFRANPVISRNEIRGNGTGVWSEKLTWPRILGNRIFDNGVGIRCDASAYPEIRGNNLFGNRDFAVAVGDRQSSQGEQTIRYRAQGRAFGEPERLPPNNRKTAPRQVAADGTIDARGNWWGRGVVEQMAALGEGGNLAAVEDGLDLPLAGYEGRQFPRDTVRFAPWEDRPVEAAGRPWVRYSGVRGRVVAAGQPVSGVRVHAYRDAAGAFRGEGFTYSAPTGPDGAFSLTLRPGEYHLVAKGSAPPFPQAEPGAGDWYGRHRGNPVTVTEGDFVEAEVGVGRLPGPLASGEGGGR
ncbi:MAG: right-handed parallel beta-helix repeat-containing protein [Deferrisomatales bacterium]